MSPTAPAAGAETLRAVESIRADVPALARTENGLPVAHFDGPGGTQVPEVVANAVREHLLAHNGLAGWRLPTSREAERAVADFRLAVADLLGSTPDGVVFGPNMTSLTVRFAAAYASRLEPGDEIVVTRLDHRANVDPWRRLAAERGATLRSVPIGAEGLLDVDALEALLGPRTRIVAVTAASNAIGTVVDLGRIGRRVRDAGALLYVDAVHATPHLPIDVGAFGCDALVCSPYKFYGPHCGVLWMRDELIEELDPPRIGPAPDRGPGRWETGTPSFEAMAGVTAAIDWLASLAAHGGGRPARLRRVMAALHARGDELVRRLWEGLSAVDGVRLYGPAPGAPRTPTVAFRLEGADSAGLARRLSEERAVFVSHGSFYAPDVFEDLGVADPTGVVRAGCACYTTEEEVDRLVAGVAEIAAGR